VTAVPADVPDAGKPTDVELWPPALSELERAGREAGKYFTAADLMTMLLPEPRWAVPGLVAEGLTLLVGAPKLGKSWLCLGLAVAVAGGGRALGRIEVQPGPVLYAALEDNPRRLQDRLRTILGGDPAPDDLHMVTALPRLPLLGEYLSGWLKANPTARLVIVDVLQKVRARTDGRGSVYTEDSECLGCLKALADQFGVPFVVVHHTRKMRDEGDVINEVSGSTGLTGAADAVLILKRARNTAEAVLHVTGRDISEGEHALTWDASRCLWAISDVPVMVAAMRDTRRSILAHLTEHPGHTPQQITASTGMNLNTVKSNVRRMVGDDQLSTDGQGHYSPPVTTGATATGATESDELQQLHGLHHVSATRAGEPSPCLCFPTTEGVGENCHRCPRYPLEETS